MKSNPVDFASLLSETVLFHNWAGFLLLLVFANSGTYLLVN